MMKKVLAVVFALALAVGASAQKTVSLEGADESVRLWDNSTAQHSNYESRDEIFYKKRAFMQTSSCELYIFKAAEGKNTGAAVALYPGGGYIRLNVAQWLVDWLTSHGITVAIVKYRLPNIGHYQATIEDGMGAVRYLRTRTDLGIDPNKVGVMGSSAGGHLASWVSNAMADGEKPAFAVLLYPWIDLTNSHSKAAYSALTQLLGKGYTLQDAINLSTHHMVSATTSPTMLLLSDNDRTVSSEDSANYYEALIRHNVKASMHIFPFGGHSVTKHTAEFQPLVIEWLKYLGIISKK
jgi:acetyl esterase/lipase